MVSSEDMVPSKNILLSADGVFSENPCMVSVEHGIVGRYGVVGGHEVVGGQIVEVFGGHDEMVKEGR
jgi:hypothetical protein